MAMPPTGFTITVRATQISFFKPSSKARQVKARLVCKRTPDDGGVHGVPAEDDQWRWSGVASLSSVVSQGPSSGGVFVTLPEVRDGIEFRFADIPERGVQLYTEVWTSTSEQGLTGTWSKARKGNEWGILPQVVADLEPQGDATKIPLLNNGSKMEPLETLDVTVVVKMDDAFVPSAPDWEQALHQDPEVGGVPEVRVPEPSAVLTTLRTASDEPYEWKFLATGRFANAMHPAPTHDLHWLLVGASVSR